MNTTITTILSVIAGGIITYLIAKWQMKKNRIDHYFINSYDIGKGLTDVFPDFSLHYGNEILANNVKVIQGGFMNVGKNDIGENGEKTVIKLLLPVGCAVKAVKLFPLVSGLVVNRVDDKDDKKNVVVFSVDGIFKTNECFEYSIITEVPEYTGSVEGKMLFEHRIKNTKDIQTIYIGQYQNRMIDKFDKWFSVFGVVLFSGFLISVLCIDRFSTMYFSFFQGSKGMKWMSYIFLFNFIILIIGLAGHIIGIGRKNYFIKVLKNKKLQNNNKD